ncbi:dihydrofolate reductase [Bdellovibrio sp. HCB337]|uniref:dihydrofolate reductase n=1 Tax=Bdellovibrio sp. HCB337 TaxID=3394358 RepID=UPI0039A472B6
MILTHVTAMSQNRVIGTQNKLPWNIPEDLKFFRDTTKGHIMIMGRKTFDSIGAKPLPQRFHIVITRQDLQSTHPLVKYVKTLDEAIEAAKPLTAQWGEEVFIVGGGEIYKQSMPVTDKIYLTVIYKDFEGDTYYPEVPMDKFELVAQSDRTDPVPFSFLTYKKK